ncbi:MAG: SpoIIE family protein phosphatase [Gammaproteobacteria bacterium]|jgi:sigma-B regulation protein RsbU (phosphoserine phosphatase)|nr:SpoIIE family protein phosphatase [Gammaproteobacteria bacterium]MDH3819739.1 SpoIIE family protein phosphatase [Gammaproteobacteria bacterium]MDH3983837.1 SpoIIE family protein phosphatase [Gammaproteobacteria bacterium]
MTVSASKPVVLAVDDTPENLDVVKGILATDYMVKAAINGEMALKIVEKAPPDLILLDIMMPGMSGYEVCEQLKANPDTRDIPVIFLTAMEQTTDEAKGFDLGAADYITKPVNPPILQARVRTHLALKQSMDELQAAYAIIKKHSERMEQELSVGHDIQMSMLPITFPEKPEFALHACLQPAREVGGDFYDFFFVDDDKICLVVGDVSGKGVPAALFMAVTKTMLKTQAADDPSPASIVTRVNDDLSADNPASMFVTLFIAIVNTRTGEFCYTNAGHNPPYVLRGDTTECLNQRHGPVLGAVEGVAFRESNSSLLKDDTLLVFTDGVTEAMNTDDQLYTEARLEELISGNTNKPDSLTQRIIDDVEKYATGAEQADDITILAYRADAEPVAAEVALLQLTIKSDLKEIERVNTEFGAFAAAQNVPPGATQKVCIVFDELLNNAISYGFDDDESHEIDIEVAFYKDHLLIEVSDDGIPFNPFDRVGPDTTLSIEEREVGGLGVFLVTEMMDECQYQRHKNKNSVIMTLKLQD